MVTEENEQKYRCVTRNSSFFKQIGDQKVTGNDNKQSSVEDKEEFRYALRKNVKPPYRLNEET